MSDAQPDFLRQLTARDAGKGLAKDKLQPEAPADVFEEVAWRWSPGDPEPVLPAFGGYAWKTQAFRHQRAALAACADEPAFALLMEMGTGKTKVIIDDWARRVEGGEAQDLFVCAPAGVYLNWVDECFAHVPDRVMERTVVGAWLTGGASPARLVGKMWPLSTTSGAAKDRIAKFLGNRAAARVLLVNAEALSVVPKAQELVHLFLKDRRSVAAIDESTILRSPDSARTKALTELGVHATFRRIATGFPTPKSPLDLFGQFMFLDWRALGYQNFYGFKARYAIEKKMKFTRPDAEGRAKTVERKIVVGYRNVEELRDKIAGWSFRVLKKDCLDLPPKLYTRRDVELTDELRRVYEEVKRHATSELNEMGDTVTATDVMTRRLRLIQVANGFVTDEHGKEHELEAPKIDCLIEVLQEHRGKAIVWAPWKIPLRRIHERMVKEFGAQSVVRFWGEVKIQEREEAVDRFQKDPTCRWIVANPMAMGRGRTLTEASLCVYVGNWDDLEIRLNSEDRPHRIGLKHPVTYLDLVSPRTVEEKQLKSFGAKLDLAATVMGEPRKEWLE